MSNRPTNINEYKQWLHAEHKVNLTRARGQYDTAVLKIREDVQLSDSWKALNDSLGTMNQKYRMKTGYDLLVSQSPLELFRKSFDSFLVKTFRKNILKNDNWPKPPSHGWLLPENWLTRINDIIRSLLVVKYLDGVSFAAEEIERLFRSKQQQCSFELEARIEGYYAAHLYTWFTVSILGEEWDVQNLDVSLEIQITTQVQEVIRRLLHEYYEERRVATQSGDSLAWQWDYKSTEFAANYLGHVLHYVEGMIMEIRDKQEIEEP